MKTGECLWNVVRHGEINGAILVVPGEFDATKKVSLPISRYLIMLFQRVLQVLCMRQSDGFDSEIVHDKTEGDRTPFMPPEARGVLTLVVSFFVEALC